MYEEYNYMDDIIGNRLAMLRKKRGLSLRQLALLSDVPQGNLSAIESGKRIGGRLSLLSGKRLAQALGVSLDYLVGMYDDNNYEDLSTDTATPSVPHSRVAAQEPKPPAKRQRTRQATPVA
jgi:transcriptional regulator with XRE-family HTH domain